MAEAKTTRSEDTMSAEETIPHSPLDFNDIVYIHHTAGAFQMPLFGSVALEQESSPTFSFSGFHENERQMPGPSQGSEPLVVLETHLSYMEYIPVVFAPVYTEVEFSNGVISSVGSVLNHGFQQRPIIDQREKARQTSTPSAEVVLTSLKKYYMCEYCDGGFDDYYTWMFHKEGCTSKEEESIAAESDSKTRIGISKEAYQTHCATAIPRRRQRVPKKSKLVSCTYCQKTFSTIEQMKRHERVHTGVRPYTCYVCKVNFASYGSIINHIKLKHPEKNPYTCCQCKMTFKTPEESKSHRKSHVFRRKKLNLENRQFE